MHFLTLRVWAAPPPSPGDPQPRGPARSERGREGTMSCEPGMCPQRLFTNTQLFMIAGKRNPTRAAAAQTSRAESRPRSCGEGGSFPDPLRGSGRAPRARRGAARQGPSVRLGLRARRLCLRGAEGLRPWPCSGLKGPGALSFSLATPRALFLGLFPPHPNPLSCPQPGSGKTPSA